MIVTRSTAARAAHVGLIAPRLYSRAVATALALIALLGACTDQTQVRSLVLSPASSQALVGAEVAFTAELTPADPAAEYVWQAAHGSIIGSGPSVQYAVPASPGLYTVSVTVDGNPPVTAHASVQVLAAPPEIALGTTGAEPRIVTGGSLELVVTGPGSSAELVWDVSSGSLDAEGATAVYTAPDAPGYYTVGVEIAGMPSTRTELTVEVPGGLLESFTLIVVPDTQTMARYAAGAARLVGLGEWIVDSIDDRNIAFVTQVGDVVWHANVSSQWTRARAGLDLLRGEVPFSVALGDHEYYEEEQKDGDTGAYVAFFGPARYASYDWYRGSHPDGLSHYQVFEAGGREFLHLSLEWEPLGPASDPSTPLGWAKSVLAAHPDLPTIITTHAYLWDTPGQLGHFPDSAREGWRWEGDTKVTGFTTSGEGIYQALVHPHPQVFMVVSGHYHKYTSDPDRRGEYHQVSVNASGGEVYEMLADYQWIGVSADIGGDDWLRIVTFEPGFGEESDRIEVETFSPERFGSGEPAFKTGEWSEFGFDIDFAQRFAQR